MCPHGTSTSTPARASSADAVYSPMAQVVQPLPVPRQVQPRTRRKPVRRRRDLPGRGGAGLAAVRRAVQLDPRCGDVAAAPADLKGGRGDADPVRPLLATWPVWYLRLEYHGRPGTQRGCSGFPVSTLKFSHRISGEHFVLEWHEDEGGAGNLPVSRGFRGVLDVLRGCCPPSGRAAARPGPVAAPG